MDDFELMDAFMNTNPHIVRVLSLEVVSVRPPIYRVCLTDGTCVEFPATSDNPPHWVDAEGKPVPFDKKYPKSPAGLCWCSNCHALLVGSDKYPVLGVFCPNCGAYMGADPDPREVLD